MLLLLLHPVHSVRLRAETTGCRGPEGRVTASLNVSSSEDSENRGAQTWAEDLLGLSGIMPLF